MLHGRVQDNPRSGYTGVIVSVTDGLAEDMLDILWTEDGVTTSVQSALLTGKPTAPMLMVAADGPAEVLPTPQIASTAGSGPMRAKQFYSRAGSKGFKVVRLD